jgi:hypothetical protein
MKCKSEEARTMYPESFEVQYNDKPVKVEVLSITGQTIYRLHFRGQPPLIITRAKKNIGSMFWTSIPEGKQKLAEEIGLLIEEYFKTIS